MEKVYLGGKEYSAPDFSAWKKDETKTRSGITFAPEDFCLTDSEGRRKELFTWREAMELEERILRQNGWRLPTDDEWSQMIRELGHAGLRNKLKLCLNGCVNSSDMPNYNSSLVQINRNHGKGEQGFYWSRTAYSSTVHTEKYACGMFLDKNGAFIYASAFTFATIVDNGLSVRCVCS